MNSHPDKTRQNPTFVWPVARQTPTHSFRSVGCCLGKRLGAGCHALGSCQRVSAPPGYTGDTNPPTGASRWSQILSQLASPK